MQAGVVIRDAESQCEKETRRNRFLRAAARYLPHGLARRGSLGRIGRARNEYKDPRAAASGKLPQEPPGLDVRACQTQANLGAAPPDRPRQSWRAGFQPAVIRSRWRRPCHAARAALRFDELRATIAKSRPTLAALLAVKPRRRTCCKAGPTDP